MRLTSSASSRVLLAVAAVSELAHAVRLSIHGRREQDTGLRRRGNVVGSSPLNNTGDVSYYTNITLGGSPFTVLIDTGSSDLWVAGTVKDSQDTGKNSGVTYAVGAVKGPVKTSTLEFAGYTVPNQAYLEIKPGEETAGTGLIGLGPNSGSNVFRTLNSSAGHAVLDRIFLQNTSAPNFITVMLGRSHDPTDPLPGDLTVGELLPGYESVTSQPKLIVTDVPIFEVGDQHFQLLVDEDGLIGPDGNSIPVRTAVDETKNKKQVTAIVDTGFSLSQVPKNVADSIYSRFEGAEFVNVTGVGKVWIAPCTTEVNITIKLGGVRYPIHPMDALLDPTLLGLTNVRNQAGERSCIGTYQPVSFNLPKSPNFDMILGMSFLRNVYTLIDFGDFIAGSTNKGDPYIQLLSVTDPAEAHSDFVQVRLNGIDTTDGQVLKSSSTPQTTSSRKRTIIYIIGASLIALGLVLAVLAFVLARSRRNKMVKGGMGASTASSWASMRPGGRQGAYHPLNDPAPSDAHAPPPQYNPNAQYDPSHQGQYAPQGQQSYPYAAQQQPLYQNSSYQNPWDHRY
ncbi:hypothetical protein HGRIS_005766 [Hohenbuehelia grisea]|uniref:Peptidase A1 domain-containing protein n=1 Tax=Hohenbuehelia grisea TaxID=104357 RepID=A0ABR3JYR4_9AGAR